MTGTVKVGTRGRRTEDPWGPLSLSETVSVRLTAADVEQLNAVAAHHGVDVSVIVRRYLRLGLQTEGHEL